MQAFSIIIPRKLSCIGHQRRFADHESQPQMHQEIPLDARFQTIVSEQESLRPELVHQSEEAAKVAGELLHAEERERTKKANKRERATKRAALVA